MQYSKHFRKIYSFYLNKSSVWHSKHSLLSFHFQPFPTSPTALWLSLTILLWLPQTYSQAPLILCSSLSEILSPPHPPKSTCQKPKQAQILPSSNLPKASSSDLCPSPLLFVGLEVQVISEEHNLLQEINLVEFTSSFLYSSPYTAWLSVVLHNRCCSTRKCHVNTFNL